MFSDYFQGRLHSHPDGGGGRCFFSIPYLGLQLRASGFLFHVLTDEALGIEVGMWLLSAVVFHIRGIGRVAEPWPTWDHPAVHPDWLSGSRSSAIIGLSYIGGFGCPHRKDRRNWSSTKWPNKIKITA